MSIQSCLESLPSERVLPAFAYATPRGGSDTRSGKEFVLEPSQRKAFQRLQGMRWAILIAPTGWGKSLCLCCLAGADLRSDSHRKVVICVPQRIISKGFVSSRRIVLPDGTRLDWHVLRNYCQATAGKVASLRQFLLSPGTGPASNRVVVTTHKGLAAAFHGLSEADRTQAVRQTTFFFDEAHHVQASEEIANKLGLIVTNLLSSTDPSVRAVLATAFFFRGDRLPILTDEQARHFERLAISFDEYWYSLRHLEGYRYDFVIYEKTVWEALDGLFAKSQVPTIIYCPPEGHDLLGGRPKAEFVERVVRTVQRRYGVDLWRPGGEPEDKVILDLVSAEGRAEKVQFAMNHGDRIAVVLTVGMFREGADWVQAERVIDLIPSGSDQDRNQRFGRLFRDHPGKRFVSYYSFFRRVPGGGKDERLSLTTLYAHFHATLVLENALVPIRVPKNYGSRSGGTREREDFLGRYDEQKQSDILGDCCDALGRLIAEEENGGKVTHDRALEAILATLERWGIVDDLEPMAKQIVLILRRRANLSLPVDDLVEAGFDKVWASDALDGLRLYSAGIGGPTTFSEIRRAVRTVFDARWEEMYEQVSKLPCPPSGSSRAKWWVNYNKGLHLQGALCPKRAARLERIRWWSWGETYGSRFDRQYEALKLLSSPPSPSDPLYVFVSVNRDRHRLGKLSVERVALLEAIPWWTWRTRDVFKDLVEEARLMPHEPKTGTRIGQWVWRTRDRFSRGELAPGEISLVETIPWWSWTAKRDRTWQDNYDALKGLAEPPEFRALPKLYKFMHAQKEKRRAGRLSEEHAAMLEGISWWAWS